MPIPLIEFNATPYPKFQSEGNAAQFIFPFARRVCIGRGVDVGCGKHEWSFPGAMPVDPALNSHHATNYPHTDLDYVFSSHCLEHIDSWYTALEYWYASLRIGGVIFLYLPDYSQEYWRPWNNLKHKHSFIPRVIEDALTALRLSKIFVSGVDLNNSFAAMGEKV